MDDNLVPLLAIFFIFGGPVIAFVVVRVLRHQERIEMIRRGMVPPPGGGRAYRQWSRAQQQGAQPWTMATPPPYAGPVYDDSDPQTALFKGIRLAIIGFAILLGLSFIGGTPGVPGFHTGPWLLGGLIPMFVGIAQIIIAVLSGAQLPGQMGSTTFVPPPQPPPGAGMPPPPRAPGAWEQPGRPHFEELSRPVPPPDVR